jgi:cytochrome P450
MHHLSGRRDDGTVTEVLPSADFLLADSPRRHAEYARLLRGTGAVYRITLQSGAPAWLVTGYDAVRRALTDPRLSGRTGAVGDRRKLPEAVRLGMNSHMLNTDPPDHTRLRRLISAAFTRPRIEQMRTTIQRITDERLDAMADRYEVDLIETLATPLPIRVLTELLGVPPDKADAFRDWTTTLTASAVPLDELDAAATEMLEYTRALLALKRRVPRDDLLSALVAVRDGADRLTEDELTSMVFLLLIAGQETTVNLIGNATLALLTNPSQLDRLRTDVRLMPDAVEEFLRYESPVHAALRHATAPVTLAGVAIPAGAVVILSLLAANRDPDRFPHPDVLDTTRTEIPHVAFGHGIHHCLGAPLARLEGAIALRSLLARYPRLRLAVPPATLIWRVSLVMHGLVGLPVLLR